MTAATVRIEVSLLVTFGFGRWFIKNWFPEIIVQALYPDIVLLADVFAQFLSRGPRNIPGYGPGSGVCAGVIDRRFVMQCVLVWPRYLFDHVQLTGMRMPPLVQPGSFVVAGTVDHQRVALPMSY